MQPAPDITCPTCNYDLTGLTGTATCPECGLPKARHRALQRKKSRSPLWKFAYIETGAVSALTVSLGVVVYFPTSGALGLILGLLCLIPYAIILAFARAIEDSAVRAKSARHARSAMSAILVAGAGQWFFLLIILFGPPDPFAALLPIYGAVPVTLGGVAIYGLTFLALTCIDRPRGNNHI